MRGQRLASQLETQRRAALQAYHVLDTLPEQGYDDIALLAAQLCRTPSAGVALMDDKRVWFKAGLGLSPEYPSSPREHSFCARVVETPNAVLLVPDARVDERFANHPTVKGKPFVRAYAGAPILTEAGIPVGAVCAFDSEPRQWCAQQSASLQALARQVTRLLEMRRHTESQIKQARSEIDQTRAANEYLEAFSAVTLDLKSIIDRDYVYRHVNEMYLHYWRKQRDQIIGHSVAELVGTEKFEQTLKPLLDRALQGETVTYDEAFDFPSKGKRYTRVTYLPALGSQREIIGVIVRVEDIDDLKQVELSLRRSVQLVEDKNIALQRFIQILSHDLREPVNTIINFTSLLKEPSIDASAASRYIEFLHGSGLRLRALLDDLKAYMDLERYTISDQQVSLDEVLQEVKQELSCALTQSQAELVEEPLPTVRGERSLLRVVMQNLIANAIKFVASGVRPRITITAVQREAAWELQVRDNGIGIPPEQREAVFDLFKRLHSQRHYPGTGLGLATCRRIAELHDGSIWVTTTAQGGSCFHVLLPLCAKDRQDTAALER